MIVPSHQPFQSRISRKAALPDCLLKRSNRLRDNFRRQLLKLVSTEQFRCLCRETPARGQFPFRTFRHQNKQILCRPHLADNTKLRRISPVIAISAIKPGSPRRPQFLTYRAISGFFNASREKGFWPFSTKSDWKSISNKKVRPTFPLAWFCH